MIWVAGRLIWVAGRFDLGSRTLDLGRIELSDLSRAQGTLQNVLCRSKSMLSKELKSIRHGLKVAQFGLDVAQRFLHFPCPDLRAGVGRALSVLSAGDIEASGKRCLSGHEQSESYHSRRHSLPKLLFGIL